jgi:chromosome partitioning protein
MAKVISITNHKGGVGKTTSVVNIGAGLHNLGKRILLVDLDPQENLTLSVGLRNMDINIYGALKGDYKAKPITLKENFAILPSTLDLSGAEVELSAEAGREYILSEILDPIKHLYDYILIDCPPSLGLLTVNALTASNEAFIPIQAHYLAIKGLSKMNEVIEKIRKRLNKELQIGGVFITMFDKRKVLCRDVVETVKSFFQDKVYETRIRENISLAEAPYTGKDIFEYNPKCFGAEDYASLCLEFLEREKKLSI